MCSIQLKTFLPGGKLDIEVELTRIFLIFVRWDVLISSRENLGIHLSLSSSYHFCLFCPILPIVRQHLVHKAYCAKVPHYTTTCSSLQPCFPLILSVTPLKHLQPFPDLVYLITSILFLWPGLYMVINVMLVLWVINV